MQRNKNNEKDTANKTEVSNNDVMKSEIEKLKEDLSEKNNRIKELENSINLMNTKYKNDLVNKSKEAQEKINEKINDYKTKIDSEVSQIKKYAMKNDAIELINIIGQLSSVVNSKIENEQVRNYVNGFKMFIGMFDNLLTSMNIHKLDIKENDKFNENTMEAVDVLVDNSKEENTIHKIVKDGYKLHDQMLIYAQVIVYKKK